MVHYLCIESVYEVNCIMYCTRKITNDITWVGASDRRLHLFENVYPIPRGASFNSYVISDEKTCLMDTVDYNCGRQFFENVEHALNGRPLDYIVVDHMEPDHAATLQMAAEKYPAATIVCNAKTLPMIQQFFTFDAAARSLVVSEGDTLCLGRHTLSFVMAPMVHWPEVMVTYDTRDKVLFSADAFGTFGALDGYLFNDEVNFDRDWLDDARRYYTNIVGKYSPQVQKLLGKAAGLDIAYICPLHGPVWRSDFGYILDKYNKWSSYTPEDKGVFIAYASMYGDTENAANILACELAELGVKNVVIRDVSNTDESELIALAFRLSHLVLCSPTYNALCHPKMEHFITGMKHHGLCGRTVALVENGSWAPAAAKAMTAALEGMKNLTVLEENKVTFKSSLKDRAPLEALARVLAKDL